MISFDGVPEVLKSGLDRAAQAVKSGASFVQERWNALPFFASVEAATQPPDERPRDETHYYLIPYRLEPCGYALYTTRRVPAGFADANDLPRLRVFHLPGPGGEALLEGLVVKTLTRSASLSAADPEQTVAARLERIADEIDQKGRLVTGGFLLVGGVAAIFNPLLGVGIAAKALFPSVGALLSREGIKHVSGKLRARDERNQQAAAEASARAELARTSEVRSVVNPLLAELELALSTSERHHDPLLEYDFERFELPGWEPWEMLTLSARAITAVYRDLVADSERHASARLGPEDVRWLGLVARYAERAPG